MVESSPTTRSYLILGVCVTLAVVLGYFLASPLESDSLGVILMVLAVLVTPLLLRWHHPLLVFSWNAPIFLSFLPGNMAAGTVMVFVSLFFTLLDRAMGRSAEYPRAPQLTRSLAFFAVVVVVTAWLTGGVGIRALGGSSFGGRKYILLLTGIVAYFAISGQRIPRAKAQSYGALYFLSGFLVLIGIAGDLSGGGGGVLQSFFPESFMQEDEGPTGGVVRWSSINFVTIGLFCFLLMRYGVRGVLDVQRPWRGLLLVVTLGLTLLAGFRSVLVLYFVLFATLFYLERLYRTRLLPIILLGGLLTGAAILPFIRHFPLSVQRTLSFLPVEIDSVAQNSAAGSTEWRLQMWEELLPDVPKYLIKGKGYSVDPNDMFMVWQSGLRGYGKSFEFAQFNGDYHSGPFSVLIPFGLFGVAAFIWFCTASLRILYLNYRDGEEELRGLNRFLLALFITRLFFFVFIFGSISSDLIQFTGLVGLGVSLNHRKPARSAEGADVVTGSVALIRRRNPWLQAG